MMIRFVGYEMTLKTTLLVCDPMVISNALVSCVIGFKKKLQLSLTLMPLAWSFSPKVV
jgi:hypothetical protein